MVPELSRSVEKIKIALDNNIAMLSSGAIVSRFHPVSLTEVSLIYDYNGITGPDWGHSELVRLINVLGDIQFF